MSALAERRKRHKAYERLQVLHAAPAIWLGDDRADALHEQMQKNTPEDYQREEREREEEEDKRMIAVKIVDDRGIESLWTKRWADIERRERIEKNAPVRAQEALDLNRGVDFYEWGRGT